MVFLVSACLLGLNVRYDGTSKAREDFLRYANRVHIVPFCPEILGGLGIPRSPCRFTGGDGKAVIAGTARVMDRESMDRTDSFLRGAREALTIVRLTNPDAVILKDGSPSCGLKRVDIDGISSPGVGVTSAFLLPTGIPLISDEDPAAGDFDFLKEFLRNTQSPEL